MKDNNGQGGIPIPTVSVITPCWNSEPWLHDCVRSVREAVTCDRFRVEHIVVDDGSTDGSLALLHRLAVEPNPVNTGIPYNTDSYLGLRVVAHKHVGMPSELRNEGIKRASGRYIFCLDSDDVLLQNALRYMVEHLEANPKRRWAYGDFTRVGKNLEYIIGHDYYGWPHTGPRQLLHSVFRGDHFYQHSMMFQRSLFAEVGGYDPAVRMGEDLDLCARFVMAGAMPKHLNINTHLHREHGTNMTAHFGREEHMEDVRNHYEKHKYALTQFLTADDILDIETTIGIRSAAKSKQTATA